MVAAPEKRISREPQAIESRHGDVSREGRMRFGVDRIAVAEIVVTSQRGDQHHARLLRIGHARHAVRSELGVGRTPEHRLAHEIGRATEESLFRAALQIAPHGLVIDQSRRRGASNRVSRRCRLLRRSDARGKQNYDYDKKRDSHLSGINGISLRPRKTRSCLPPTVRLSS